MRIFLTVLLISALASGPASAQSFTLILSSDDIVASPLFSDVATFRVEIEVDAPLAIGVYDDPPLTRVNYQVMGDLVTGTPSGFPSFALSRDISGTEFYNQGSSLAFEISSTAVLSDGLQVQELVGNDVVFTFNAREIDNGRFHPALLRLNDGGVGSLQNSNNIISQNPFQQVDFGQEYITALTFDPGNLTITAPVTAPPVTPPTSTGSGGGALSALELAMLLLFGLWAVMRR